MWSCCALNPMTSVLTKDRQREIETQEEEAL